MIPRILITFALCMMRGVCAHAQDTASEKRQLDFFFTPSCHVCHEVDAGVITPLREKESQTIAVIYRDISDVENYKLFLGHKQRSGSPATATVPAVFFEGRFLVGKEAIVNGLPALVCEKISSGLAPQPQTCSADLEEHFATFTPLAVTGAGIIDGVNPCAFTVIVFFISFLGLQGYRKRDLIVIGLVFIAAVFLTYLLLGIGLFAFFYGFSGIWMLRRILNAVIGSVSIVLAALSFFDAWIFMRTGNAEDAKLRLPDAVKHRIHAVIGMHHRKDKAAAAPSGPAVLKLAVAAFSSGFLVSLLEAVCTGQTYVPTISFILKTTSMKARALGYLVWYNLMFILPLVLIFIGALFGLTSSDFAGFLRRHFVLTKIMIAALFLSLGIFLLWRG